MTNEEVVSRAKELRESDVKRLLNKYQTKSNDDLFTNSLVIALCENYLRRNNE